MHTWLRSSPCSSWPISSEDHGSRWTKRTSAIRTERPWKMVPTYDGRRWPSLKTFGLSVIICTLSLKMVPRACSNLPPPKWINCAWITTAEKDDLIMPESTEMILQAVREMGDQKIRQNNGAIQHISGTYTQLGSVWEWFYPKSLSSSLCSTNLCRLKILASGFWMVLDSGNNMK